MAFLQAWLRNERPLDEYFDGDRIPRSPDDIAADSPLRFRARFPVRLIVAMPLMTAAFVALMSVVRPVPLPVAVSIGGFILFIGGAFYGGRLGWSVVLRRECVEFHQWSTIVRCPWPLFASEWPAQADEVFEQVLIPLREEWAAEIVKVRRGGIRAEGVAAATLQCSFPTGSKMRLRGHYGFDLEEIAALIRFLALNDAASYAVPAIESEVGHDASGDALETGHWRTLDLARLALPKRCCGCAGTGDLGWHDFDLGVLRVILLALFHMHPAAHKTLPLPICRACHKRRLKIMLIGFAAGTIVASIAITIWFWWGKWYRDPWDLVGFALLGSLGGCAAAPFAWFFSLPARFANFSRRRETVRLWVRDPRCWDG